MTKRKDLLTTKPGRLPMNPQGPLHEASDLAQKRQLDRRSFLKIVTMAAASVGLSSSVAVRMAEAATAGLKPSVIWLHFQECTGCTESLLRTAHPDVAQVILDLVSLDYHETLAAAAGHQIEEQLHATMEAQKGKYICVVEGAIPEKDGGIYCKIAGRTAVDILNEVAADAAAVVALGSCASFGGLPAAPPNPTGATGAPMILEGKKPVVTIPGCPANPYNFLGVVLQFATLGTLPALDDKGRPKFAYGRTIHEDCPRRPHFDAGRFAEQFGGPNHREGDCLYKLGCKGPATHANCSLKHFGEVDNAWPIGVGHPCVGCTEKALAFRVPIHDTVDIERPTPPDTYPPINSDHGGVSPAAVGVGGAIVGGVIGATLAKSKKLDDEEAKGE
jgi:hydrogenase small subunit